MANILVGECVWRKRHKSSGSDGERGSAHGGDPGIHSVQDRSSTIGVWHRLFRACACTVAHTYPSVRWRHLASEYGYVNNAQFGIRMLLSGASSIRPCKASTQLGFCSGGCSINN